MPFTPVRTVAPAASPVSLAEAKAHLSIDAADWDDPLQVFIDAAVTRFDGWSGLLGRCLVNQTWRLRFEEWPADGVLRFPFPDVSAATIKYYASSDGDATLTTVSPSPFLEIMHDARGSYVKLKPTFTAPALYDRDGPVVADIVAGFGAAASDVPGALRTAILLTIGHLWENRADSAPIQIHSIPLAAEMFAAPFRRTFVV